MYWENNVYWFGSYLQALVMIAFLVDLWRTKNCSGVSLRSQFMYALVFTTRHRDLIVFDIPVENIILKIVYLLVTYGTVLSILMYFLKTYEKQHDKARIDIWIVACLLLGLILSDRFDFLSAFTAFSIFLETVAMIPQFELIMKTKRINKNVILYLSAMAIYTVLYVGYSIQQFTRRPNRYDSQMAAAAVQLLLYCDFFYRSYPLLSSRDDDDKRTKSSTKLNCGCFNKIWSLLCSQKTEDVDTDVEKEEPKKGHLDSNVGNVVLTPFALTGVQNEKESSGEETVKN